MTQRFHGQLDTLLENMDVDAPNYLDDFVEQTKVHDDESEPTFLLYL